MSKGFKDRVLYIYSNFMKFTIKNTLFNILLILMENMPILLVIELMNGTDILSGVFSPLFFLAPSIYLEMINEQLPNQCNLILKNTTGNQTDNNTSVTVLNDTTFLFFNRTLITLKSTFCVYNDSLFYAALYLILLILVLIVCLAYINPRTSKGWLKVFSIVATNLVNWLLRPFSVLILTLLLQKPLLALYLNQYLNPDYYSFEMGVAIVSVFFILIFGILSSLFMQYINNSYYFEKFPYDSYSSSDGSLILVLKIFVAFQMNFQKMSNFSHINFVNLLLVLFLWVRLVSAITRRKLIINHIYLKNLRNYLIIFFALYWLFKVLNTALNGLTDYKHYTLIVEIFITGMILIGVKFTLFRNNPEFTFSSKSEFIEEIMHFFYYIGKLENQKSNYTSKQKKTESIIDNIIIGHKMKCCLEDCVLCGEDIYNPDLRTLFMVLYGQFQMFEKELKEENEEFCIILRLLFLKCLDEKKIHRISLVVLKNTKMEFHTYLKCFYLYYNLLDDLNIELKNLLTIKYGEVYDELSECIATFEEILGYIKSRTEKVELIINKTNYIGENFNKLVDDLFFIKNNKRIYFDPNNMLQIILIIRLLFHRNVDAELTENLEYNFTDFLENIDKVFEENAAFLIRYDFNNLIWRIKKVPKMFIDFTNYRSADLTDQSFEKIFPNFLAKNIVKKLEESILTNVFDKNINFNTYICDSVTNVTYVSFKIEIVPNLENNYILIIQCEFHKRQMLIVDEFGNFVNGSSLLYDKMGITSDIVIKSKGKINMYNVFNLPKMTKIEEIKIVNVSDEALYETTNNVFLLDSNLLTMPNFLEDFMKKRNEMRNKKSIVYFNLFETMTINEVKYHVFKLKINTESDNQTKQCEIQAFRLSSYAGGGHSVKRRESLDSTTSDKKKKGKETSVDDEKSEEKTDVGLNLLINRDKEKQASLPGGNNLLEYYNYFYDTQKSASVNVDYHRNHSPTVGTQINSVLSNDVFSFLNLKNYVAKKRSNKFQTFLYCTYLFNFLLVIFGLFSILFLNFYSKHVSEYISCYFIFNKFCHRVYSTTTNLFSVVKFRMNDSDTIYNDYIYSSLLNSSQFDYDNFLKSNVKYHAINVMLELNDYFNSAYQFFTSSFYDESVNFKTNFLYFNGIGNFVNREDYTKNQFGLFALSINELASSPAKTFINVSYLDMDKSNDFYSPSDISMFQSNINVYQYLFNYFSVFYKNLNQTNESLFIFGNEILDSLQIKSKILLILIVILNIGFVVISFFSVLIYRKILLKEFNTLYSINEDHLNRLKDKFKCVRELIKLETYPSKVYHELRKLKEKAPEEEKNPKKQKNVLGLLRAATNESNESNNIQNELYLKFSGAKSSFLRSNTQTVQKKIEKIKRESSRAQASIMLLQRLNFEFDLIKKFICFIGFMTVFFTIVGVFTFLYLDNNYSAMKMTLNYTDLFLKKNQYFYNYYSAVKLTIIFNDTDAFTMNNVDPTSTSNINEEILSKFYNVTDQLHRLQSDYSYLNTFYLNDMTFDGQYLCTALYDNPNDLIDYLKTNSTLDVVGGLLNLCKAIPILQSNLDTVFTDIVVYIRTVEEKYKSHFYRDRVDYLNKDFLLIDIVFGIFAEPYFSYVRNNLLPTKAIEVTSAYNDFIVIIFSLNIIIDFLMLWYIWFNIYKKIIDSVNNVHLVTDSVSTI